MTQIETTAKNAYGKAESSPSSAGRVMISAAAQDPSTANAGTRWWLSRVQTRCPGTARSRENAYIMREQLVTQAMPQNSWPIVAISTTALLAVGVSALENTASDEPRPSLTASTSEAANVIASSTNQPIRPAQNTDRQMPLAALSEAPFVSSDR